MESGLEKWQLGIVATVTVMEKTLVIIFAVTALSSSAALAESHVEGRGQAEQHEHIPWGLFGLLGLAGLLGLKRTGV